jgi:competence ComEA-like helix-hairpin-helix protein
MQSHRRRKSSTLLLTLLLASLSALAATEGKPVVNINTADAKQLAFLPRVGASLAERIVDYRKENGPFKSTDELMLVRGVGEKLYAQLKPYLAISGETTLDEKVAGQSRASKAKSGKGSAKTRSRAGGKTPPPKAAPAAHAAPDRSAARAARAKRSESAPAITLKTAGGPR